MITRYIDELKIYSLIIRLKRFNETKQPRTAMPTKWADVPSVPIGVYNKGVRDFAQSILVKCRSNIECNVYSEKDLWNWLIVRYALGEGITCAERMPSGYDEIVSVSVTLSKERVRADKETFRKIHQKFIREGVIGKDKRVPDVYYECPDGSTSIMYRLMKSGSIGHRFYWSGLQNTTKNTNTPVGIVESTYRKFIPLLLPSG